MAGGYDLCVRGTSADVTATDSNTPTGHVDADNPAKPESPTELTKPSWWYVARKTAHEFSTDQCTDLAAALTYYAVLSLFPALLALVSLLGVFGQGQQTVDAMLQIVEDLGPTTAVDTLRDPITQLVSTPAAGLALVTGLLGALWSASGYVGAFGRAMNRMYEVEEGRPFWKLRPIVLAVTLVGLILAAAPGVQQCDGFVEALLAHEDVAEQVQPLGLEVRRQPALHFLDGALGAIEIAARVPDLAEIEPGAVAHSLGHGLREQRFEARAGLVVQAER